MNTIHGRKRELIRVKASKTNSAPPGLPAVSPGCMAGVPRRVSGLLRAAAEAGRRGTARRCRALPDGRRGPSRKAPHPSSLVRFFPTSCSSARLCQWCPERPNTGADFVLWSFVWKLTVHGTVFKNKTKSNQHDFSCLVHHVAGRAWGGGVVQRRGSWRCAGVRGRRDGGASDDGCGGRWPRCVSRQQQKSPVFPSNVVGGQTRSGSVWGMGGRQQVGLWAGASPLPRFCGAGTYSSFPAPPPFPRDG